MKLARDVLLSIALCAGLGGCIHESVLAQNTPAANRPMQLRRLSFAQLDGWKTTDPRAPLAAFARSCGKPANLNSGLYALAPQDLEKVCASIPDRPEANEARAFFESRFVPYRVEECGAEKGLFTGYYEPEIHASRTRHDVFQTPLYALPSDLVSVDLGLFRNALKGQRVAGRVENNALVPYATRADIDKNGLTTAKPLLFVDNPVDAFFLEIQGSGRATLDDGEKLRVVYAASNGQPYTAIGAVLVERGEFTREQVSLPAIRGCIATHPADAQELMEKNSAYVFFNEKPLGDATLGADGAGGVALSPEASLAVDRTVHPLGVPMWVETVAPSENAPDTVFHRLLVAQDTGGAITGAVRGDIYWGVGLEAEFKAGHMRSTGTLTVLLPLALATRLGTYAQFTRTRP